MSIQNWRMVAAAPGLSAEQKAAVAADVEKMVKSAAWKKSLADQGLGRHLSRRRRVRGPAQEGHRRDQRDPERDRPGEMTDGSRHGSQRRPDWAALVIAAAAGASPRSSSAGARRTMPGAADYAAHRPDRRFPMRSPRCCSSWRYGRRSRRCAANSPSARSRTSRRWSGSSAGLPRRCCCCKVAGFSIATGLLFAATARGLRPRSAVADHPGRHRACFHHLDHFRQGAAAVAAGRTARAICIPESAGGRPWIPSPCSATA